MIYKLTTAVLVLMLATPEIATTSRQELLQCDASFWPQTDEDRPERIVSGAGR